MTLEEIFLRLFVSMLLGSAIGIERQLRNHYAGLRTDTLVTLGAAGVMIFAELLPGGDRTGLARIAGQIVTGVGFLCAGVIMHEGVNVKGLNTSATLWCSACVGMFVGAGMFAPAVMLTAFIVATNLMLRPIVRYINNRTPVSDELEAHYTVTLTCLTANATRLRAALLKQCGACAAHMKNLGTKFEGDEAHICADFTFPTRTDALMEKLTGHVSTEPGIIKIEWHIQ